MADRPRNDSRELGSAAKGSRRTASLTPQIRDRLAVQLRSMYESVAAQPVPDRFADLIAKLDAQDREQE